MIDQTNQKIGKAWYNSRMVKPNGSEVCNEIRGDSNQTRIYLLFVAMSWNPKKSKTLNRIKNSSLAVKSANMEIMYT